MGIFSFLRKKEEQRSGDVDVDFTPANNSIRVNEHNSVEFMAFFACVRVISESIASLPLKTYLKGDGIEKANDHPVYNLLKLRPNLRMSSFTLRQITGYHLATWGNAYWYLVFGNSNRLEEIIPLMPNKTTAVLIRTGEIVYKTSVDDKEIYLDSSQVAHFKMVSIDGINGISPIRIMKDTIALGMSANKYGLNYFNNGTHLGGVLESPNKLSDTAYERLKKDFKNGFTGITNAHKTKILEEGLKYTKLGLPPGDSQFLETRKFQIEEIARAFRIPPHKIGDLSKTSYNSIEQQGIEFLTDTLRPYLAMIEQELNFKLFKQSELGKYYVEHDVNGILRGDVKSRYESYAIGRQWGWLTTNDIRRLENMSEMENGDILMVPLNMTPANLFGKTEPIKTESKRELSYLTEFNVAHVDEKRHSKVEVRSANKRFLLANNYNKRFSNVIEEFTKIEIEEFKRQVKKHIDTRSHVDDLFKEIKEFYNSKRSEIDSNYRKIMNEYLEELRNILEEELNQKISLKDLEEDIDKYINAYVSRHITSNMSSLNEVIKAQTELENKDYDKSLDELGQRSTNMEAMEESVRASNYFAMLVYAVHQRKARWVTTGSSSCPICKRMDGKVVSAGKPFLQKNDQIKDGDLVFQSSYEKKHPPLHTGCDCVIIAD